MTDNLALVTGGASGLGAVIARTLNRRGTPVVLVDRDPEAAQVLADELDARVPVTFIETDVSDEGAVRAMVAEASVLGRFGLVVNNAGGWTPGPQFPAGDGWHRSLDLNLRMPMLITQLVLPLMSASGAIVNVSSSGGWDSGAYGSPEYGAAKAGLIRFTTSVADFDERFGVRVSCVVPHWIGLDRAVREYEQLSTEDQQRSGGLVDPQLVADTILGLGRDPKSSGRVVVIRAGHHPYPIDPAAGDPMHGET
ncbi:MAG: SDR family oxidoreductase [Propionibacteriaceae bacterium]